MVVRNKVNYGFVGGEISPDFYGRTDIGKYDFGLRKCTNFFVDYCGGIKSRSGFLFLASTGVAADEVRLHRFRATADDYRMEFSPLKLRFLRYRDYILEAAQNIVSVASNRLTVTSHGYTTGDLIKVLGDDVLGGRYFQVGVVTGSLLELRLPGHVAALTISSIGVGATIARVYTLATPYNAAAVRELRIEQSYENFTITHNDHAPRLLTYVSDTSWTLTAQSFGSNLSAPGAATLTPSSAGTAGVAFCVTAIKNGEESVASPYTFTALSVDYSTTAGSMRVNWPAVAGAEEYNVYRTLILPTGAEISHAQAVGYIGRAIGPQFVDTNITADFTKAPPINYNPFTVSAVEEIRVTAGGTGYSNTSTVAVSGGGGSGFVGYPVVDPSGVLLSIVVLNGGSGYSAPTVTVSGGSGATFDVTLSPANGSYPALCRLFQQRMLYAATTNEPMRLWASKPGTRNNMDLSQVVNAGDGYSYQLDAQEVKPIQHLIALRHGLLSFTSEQITLLRAEEGKALSGVNAVAEPQVYKGVGKAEPTVINLDVIFAQRGSSAVIAMFYTEYTNSFQLQDLAVLSKHLLPTGVEILRFAWQSEPHKILWCLLSNGDLLSLTYEREQEVFAWARHQTQGRFRDILVVRENDFEFLYVVVERKLAGVWTTCHELMMPREDAQAENYFGVDCGAIRSPKLGQVRLDVTTDGDDYLFEVSGGLPSDLAVGDAVFFRYGKFEVTSLDSASVARAIMLRAPEGSLHVSGTVPYLLANDWGYLSPTSEMPGLWHLEGHTISVNADSDVIMDLVVEDGKVTLPQPAYKVSAGLQYICEAWTLPPVFSQEVLEGKLFDVVTAKVRLNKTRGLEVGFDMIDYQEMKDRLEEDWGQELALRSDFPEITLSAPWQELTGVSFRQTYPLPAHVLSTVLKLDVEDQ